MTTARYRVTQADAVSWLSALPDDCADLLVTSPPYEKARMYQMGDKMLAGQAWVDWMVEVVRAASPKVRGLIAINCEGQTRGYKYSCVPFLLMADLHRAGFTLRKPVVFHRVGIPGSGGPDWLRNDWEPVVCVTRGGKLPWSDNTACGHPPKLAPGGDMSYRGVNGERKNKPGKERTNRETNGHMKPEIYVPPDIANPGNVLTCDVGGSRLGSNIAHENEAPFPVDLPAFLVKSFCPPNGVCIDPFMGSGTTGQAAIENGRVFWGCDVRASQVALTERRLSGCTPPLFA